MDNENESKVIGMIRTTVESGFYSIVDVNNILPNDEALSAVTIMLRLKDRSLTPVHNVIFSDIVDNIKNFFR